MTDKISILLCLMTIFPSVVRSEEATGQLMVVKGDVKIENPQTKRSEKGRVGGKVFPGDTISTGKEARAKIVMVDKNVINVSPDSKFVIEKYVFDQSKDEKTVSLNVQYGKIRNEVNQKYDGEKNTFHVKTSSAVAGVRGTDFVVAYNSMTQVSKVVTFQGQVEVGNGVDKLGHITNSVMVRPGQFSVASSKTPPSLPVNLPKVELNTMNNQTDTDKATRVPSSQPPAPSNAPSSDKPSAPSGNLDPKFDPAAGRTPSAAPPSLMDMMGEAPVKDAVNDSIAPHPETGFLPPALPPACPGGVCLPAPINPTYLNGTTHVTVKVQ